MVVIEPLMNMSERLIFLGRGLQNMSNVGPIENINIPDELIDMMNSIERMAAEELVQEIRSLNLQLRIVLQRNCNSNILNNLINLYSRAIQ
jgi:hypothetical protein